MRVLSVLIILSLCLFIAPKQALAQANDSSTSSATIKYDLAYPGLLPDSLLYKLKVLRDRIGEAMIQDPKTKIEFYLLQADKGILASSILVDKHKIALAEDTAYKAENSYTKLTFELRKLGKRKLDTAIFNKLKNASLKHQEVLSSLAGRVSGQDRKNFEQIVDFSKTNLQTLENYQNGKLSL